MIEVEVRGKVEADKFKSIFSLLSRDGKLSDHYHRLSVDISKGFDEKTRGWHNDSAIDIRIKRSGNKEKISLKIGSFEKKSRQEIELNLLSGEFINAVELFEVLGYKTGMIYAWESWEFEYQGYEVKLSKLNDAYFTFEIEGKEKSDVDTLAKALHLKTYTPEEYRQAIDWENQNIHQIYSKEKIEKILLNSLDS